jgi:hypothetical protein
MQTPNSSFRTRTQRHHTCTDTVVGAILSGWRYDISGIPVDLRADYEDHLQACAHCRGRQRLHRTVDILLLAATTLSFAAFLLAALVMHRLEAIKHVSAVKVHLLPAHPAAISHIPSSITMSLEAVALSGVVLSMLLWILIAMVTPVPQMLASAIRERVSPSVRDRLFKQAA